MGRSRLTCPGSQRAPRGEGLKLGRYLRPRGICASCGFVYALRSDGTVIVHRL